MPDCSPIALARVFPIYKKGGLAVLLAFQPVAVGKNSARLTP
jgi:hypothetical protein